MRKAILFLLILSVFFLAPRAFAEATVWENAESEHYGTKAGGMLGRGLLNAVTCFMDIIVQTVEKTQDGPPFVGTLTGLGGGIGCTALRATSGVLDVLTFWVPGFNGFPVARSYSDCLDFEGTATDAGAPAAADTNYVAQSAPQVGADTHVVMQEEKKHDPYEYVKK